MKLPPAEARVFVHLWGTLPAEERAEVIRFPAALGERSQYVVCGKLREDESARVCATVGSASRHLFLVVSDWEDSIGAGVVARIEHYDAMERHLEVGATIVLEPEFQARSGAAAFLIARPALLGLLAELADTFDLDGSTYHCLWCVPLTSTEHELKRTIGAARLVEHLKASGRDLVASASLRASGPVPE